MGLYINKLPSGETLPAINKVGHILSRIPGSKRIDPPTEWREGLVCVVDNGVF